MFLLLMQAELAGQGCFFSWTAHFPPHPSQCLCKPPRSYTRLLMPAHAVAPLRSILLTRIVMSLWPLRAAAERSTEAQGMGRPCIRRRFEIEIGVRGGGRQAHRHPSTTPHTHSPASQCYKGSQTANRQVKNLEDDTSGFQQQHSKKWPWRSMCCMPPHPNPGGRTPARKRAIWGLVFHCQGQSMPSPRSCVVHGILGSERGTLLQVP